MNRKKRVGQYLILTAFLAAVLLISYWLFFDGGRRRAIAGIPEPVQTQTTGSTSKSVGGYDVTITYGYEYDIRALVVHTQSYSSLQLIDRLFPVDLALAWGDVAANNTKIDFHWTQRGRWYYWNVDNYMDIEPLGGVDGVNRQSANTHIIPASSSVKRIVKDIKTGDHVRLKGYLVDVDAVKPDGSTFWWYSSTTREDTGDGACEVFYVTRAEILDS